MTPILSNKHYARPSVFKVTNAMATVESDFEKGEADGNKAFMELIAAVARAWRATL